MRRTIATQDGLFLEVGSAARSWRWLVQHENRRPQGQACSTGLIDNHTHVVRRGLNYNMELRWDGVRSLAERWTC